MDASDTPKARRPLPTPGVGNRPDTPTQGSIQRPISPSQFYGTKPPPLPTRPNNYGSNLTAYVPPPSDPPRYGSPSSAPPGYREPELVEEPTIDDEPLPDLVPNAVYDQWDSTPNYSDWNGHQPPTNEWEETATWNTNWGDTATATASFDTGVSQYLSNRRDTDVPIDGRSDYEESRWWSQDERARHGRPGPGILPPVLAEDLHDPLHTLFSVNISSVPSPSSSSLPTASQNTPVPLTSSSSVDPGHAASTNPHATGEEARAAIPHPHAYYCPKDNGWVLLIWRSSTVMPPLAASFLQSGHALPDLERRKRVVSCVPDGNQSWSPKNQTHHFHRYPRAVDALKLTTPFREDSWRVDDSLKQKWRGQTVVDDVDKLKAEHLTENIEVEGKLLDLYICCQCSVYCIVSDAIPGVVPRKNLDEFARDKRHNPSPGKTPEISVSVGMETLLLAIENKMFKGNNRLIKINSSGFQSKLGWNTNIRTIFESIGFVENTANNDATLMSPLTELPGSAQNRKKLLRAWVELSAWLADFRRQHSTAFRDYAGAKLSIQIDSAREMYQRGIGAHPDQIPRGLLQEPALTAARSLHKAWRRLGLTPTTFSADLLAFAYLAQCRCDPANTPSYFTFFTEMVNSLQNSGDCPPQLQELMAMEQSRDRFTLSDVHDAATALGFGPDGLLKVEYDEDVEEEFVENAWRDAVKRSWRDPINGSDDLRTANEALRILSEARGSIRLRNLWENGKNSMSPDRAYDTLEISKDLVIPDDMLITVFNMRLEESVTQIDKMREALGVIAEVRDSERLRQFLATGQDPGDIVAPTRPDLPRGLNQLGNTCYLNSLLQYFYTIKDLREAVMPMSKLDLKSLEEEKLTEEEINKHRVGGRRVSRREIVRSKKFIQQLANLFSSMEYATSAAVTPSLELAKLALVTSRDEEEEDEVDKGRSDSSNDTDATLVDGEPSRMSVTETESSKTSVLGKRSRDLDRHPSVMDVDSLDVDGFVMVSSPGRMSSPKAMDQDSPTLTPTHGASTKDKDGDVDMKPSPAPKKRPETIDSGGMMFGKQHDVAECMDNCMFQIETALLKFDSKYEGKAGVVKRLFFGKIRQKLTATNPSSRASIHEKEDLFSHLPVNVINDGADIYDGLSGYFDDVVDYEGGKARMEVSLVDLPPLLQIQLQRVQFNRETLQPYKSQAYVKFGETIYLDRFMDSADPRKKAKSRAIQRELNVCRERIQLLLEGKNGSFGSTLEHTAGYLDSLRQNSFPGVEDHLVNDLQHEKRYVEKEIDDLRAKSDRLKEDLETLWKNSTDFPYELTSVFIHRGSSPSFGHYFFYSRHLPDNPDSWFKYNDSDVSVVSKDEVLQDTTGSTANPYLLVFARKDSNVVETVNRVDVSLTDSAQS